MALQKGHPRSPGEALYTPSLRENLFEPLCDDATREYAQGDGTPLKGKNGCLPHLWALHNSDAIAANVFHYWKIRDPGRVSHFLDAPVGTASIHFERKFQILPRGTKPNIDVALRFAPGAELDWVGIESKMVETYPATRRKLFDEKYFAAGATWWAGLDNTRLLAESFRGDGGKTEEVNRHLDRGQLIKHVLGLRNACRIAGTDPSRVMLMYFWFDVDSPEARRHEEEVAAFAPVLASDGVRFRAMTWQTVIGHVAEREQDRHPEYVAYLRTRYLPDSAPHSGA